MSYLPYSTASLLLFFLGFYAHGQCDSTASYANMYLGQDYILDGQSYRALVYDDQVAEFTSTFYEGAKYRVVAFSGTLPEQLIFSLYDSESNLLFTNSEYSNSPYWDFEFDFTVDCRIEAQLDESKQKSGCAVLLIGFER